MTYPATTSEEAIKLLIPASNQVHGVVNGGATETVATDSGDIPTLRKALADSLLLKTPIPWDEGNSETEYSQLRTFSDGLVYWAPSATSTNPIPMGATPVTDSNWRIAPVSLNFNASGGVNLISRVELVSGQTTVTTTYSVKTSTLKVSGDFVDGQDLDLGVHYTLTDDYTIELNETYPEGTILTIISRDVEEILGIPVPNTHSLTKDKLIASTKINVDDTVYIPELGNAKYVIQDASYSALVGDIELNSGLKAQLQPADDGTYNVLWFGASGMDNTIDQIAYFNLAAQRAEQEENGNTKRPLIVIPKGDWRLSEPVSTAATWVLAPNAVMYGLSVVSPSSERDTSYLTGSVITYQGVDQQRTFQAGDPSFTVQKYTGKAYTAEITGNGKLASGVTGTAHASERTTQSEGVVGGTFVAVADNQNIPQNVWGAYLEAYKTSSCDQDSNAQCLESTIFNDGTTVKQSPYRRLQGGAGSTTNLWLTTGGLIHGGTQLSNDTSFCIGMKGKEGSQYDKGIVVSTNTIRSLELIATPEDHSWAWYGLKTDGITETGAARIRGGLVNDSAGRVNIDIYDSSIAPSTYRNIYQFGLDNFTAGDSRTNFGSPLLRIQSIYLANSPDVSSDSTLKTDKSDLSQDELNAAKEIARLPKIFKWIAEVEAKSGTDETVYLHCSPMAQDVWQAFVSNNLDPTKYGFISNQDGAWSIKPQELLWMICASQQQQLDDINSRLAALEA